MKFSVLICTYQRHELLDKALSALVDGTLEKPDEIVVVNGGDQRADEVVDGYAKRQGIQVKLVKTCNVNLAASRNAGLPHCAGDIIAMTDDDAQVFPDWVTRVKRAHQEHPEAGAVGGPVIGTNPDSLIGRLADLVTFPSWREPRYVRTLPGVNISYKREVVEQIGPQDEALFRGEDVDYNWRAKKLGYEIYYDPAIKVYHYHRSTLRGFLNQHYMYGRAYYLVRHKWPEMYCVYPHGIRRLKDVLKGLNFFAAMFYEPAVIAAHMERWGDCLLTYPILVASELAWKGGMVQQFLICNLRRVDEVTG
jgi:GT2 family glycosyltransferase